MTIRRYCLDKQELCRLLELHFNLPEEHFRLDIDALVGEWYAWSLELGCIVTGLSQVLERLQNKGEDAKLILAELIRFSQSVGLFEIEHLSDAFVDQMLGSIREPDFTIEDNLVLIKRQLNEIPYIPN